MIRNILVAVIVSLVLFSTVSAKEITKGGGYSLCKKQLKLDYPNRKIDTKLLKVKFSSKKKAKAGITHNILLRIAGIEPTAYKASCVVKRDQDKYTAVVNKLD